jgi:hypothetical protein
MKRINSLEQENQQLKKKLNETTGTHTIEGQNKNNIEHNTTSTSENTNVVTMQNRLEPNYSKCLVLYGLNEYQQESEFELHDRVIIILYDITGIDLTGYIEDLSRIGKRGYRRPLKIELLSKRLTKYVLQSVKLFRNTGLWLSTYLDEAGLHQRKRERENYRQMNQPQTKHTKTRISDSECILTSTNNNYCENSYIHEKNQTNLEKRTNSLPATQRGRNSFRP